MHFCLTTYGTAHHIYDFGTNTLGYLCEQFDIPEDKHHRAGGDAEMCARLFLREIKDAGCNDLSELNYCNVHL